MSCSRLTPKRGGRLGHRHLAPLHQPRQQDQQPAQPAPAGRARGPPAGCGAHGRPRAGDHRLAATPTTSARTLGRLRAPRRGRAGRAPTTGRPAVGARHRDHDAAVGRGARPPRPRPARARPSAPAPRRPTTTRRRHLALADHAWGPPGTACGRVEPGRDARTRPPARPSTSPSMRSTRKVRTSPASWSRPDDVPEAVAGEQAVRVEPARAGRGSRSATVARSLLAVEQHRQRRASDGSAATSGRSPAPSAPSPAARASAARRRPSPRRGARWPRRAAGPGVSSAVEAEVGQLVAGPVDPVAGGAGPVAAQHRLLDRHAARRAAAALSRSNAARRAGVPVGVLAAQLVGDLARASAAGGSPAAAPPGW